MLSKIVFAFPGLLFKALFYTLFSLTPVNTDEDTISADEFENAM